MTAFDHVDVITCLMCIFYCIVGTLTIAISLVIIGVMHLLLQGRCKPTYVICIMLMMYVHYCIVCDLITLNETMLREDIAIYTLVSLILISPIVLIIAFCVLIVVIDRRVAHVISCDRVALLLMCIALGVITYALKSEL
jgi:hypothetical protein